MRVAYGTHVGTKEPKTKASRRMIPLDGRTVAVLKAHHRRQVAEKLEAGEAYTDAGWVFADEIGEPLSPGAATKRFTKLATDAGLPRLTPHGLRHTFATLGLDAGVDVLYVAEVLGHSSPAVTQDINQHTRPERKAAALRQTGDAIFG